MSLLKRLLWSVTVAMGIILGGTLLLSISSARDYLHGALQAQGENAISALAISLSQPGNQDPIVQELLMTALYDSGQLRSMRFFSPEGKELFIRSRGDAEMARGDAPAWFVRALPLQVPATERAVSDGWKQVGVVSLAVDSAYASEALWDSSTKMVLWVVAAGCIWAGFIVMLLGWFRRVLREEIAAQVMQIGSQQEQAPGTATSQLAELAPLAAVIHTTHERVWQKSHRQTVRIDSLELETNRDPVTQLPNRKFFLNELQRALQADGLLSQGTVLLFRQRDLQMLNAQQPRSSVDTWLRDVAQQARLLMQALPLEGVQLARLNGADFAVLLPGSNGPATMQAVQQLRTWLQSQNLALAHGQWTRWAYAMTEYGAPMSCAEVLGNLDQALMRAESAGHGEVESASPHKQTGVQPQHAQGEWQTILQRALENTALLHLQVHPVGWLPQAGTDGLHEASLQLQGEEGAVWGGAYFLPAATRLGLSAAFDARAIHMGLAWLEAHPTQSLVVRVSMASLGNPKFLPSLSETFQSLVQQHDLLPRLWLEVDAYALVAYASLVHTWAEVVKALGVGVGLRGLDQAPQALAHLQTLPLRYVKIGARSVDQAQSNVGKRILLQAMLQAAQEQGIAIYMVDAVSPESASWLLSQGVAWPQPSAE